MGGKGDPLWAVQEIIIPTCWQMIYAQTRMSPRKWSAQNSLGLWDKNRSPNLG